MLGFSYVGLIFLLMLFIPNFLWTRHKPEGYDALAEDEPKLLLVLERIGQVAVTACALCFSDFNLRAPTLWTLWLVAAFALMVLYEVCWGRYFAGEHTLTAFYGNQFGIPIPLATLPVAAFFLLGVYGRVVLMLDAAALLGVGHIGIHLRHRKTVFSAQK